MSEVVTVRKEYALTSNTSLVIKVGEVVNKANTKHSPHCTWAVQENAGFVFPFTALKLVSVVYVFQDLLF